jgi:hypothetical protein
LEYRAFLIRCWRDTSADPWRFSLQEVGSNLPRAGFSNFDALTAQLRATVITDPETPTREESA